MVNDGYLMISKLVVNCVVKWWWTDWQLMLTIVNDGCAGRVYSSSCYVWAQNSKTCWVHFVHERVLWRNHGTQTWRRERSPGHRHQRLKLFKSKWNVWNLPWRLVLALLRVFSNSRPSFESPKGFAIGRFVVSKRRGGASLHQEVVGGVKTHA